MRCAGESTTTSAVTEGLQRGFRVWAMPSVDESCEKVASRAREARCGRRDMRVT
jgi:hypothetical protein